MPIYCRKCGASNDANAFKCTQCGEVVQTLPAPKVENYLVLAIFTTLCCCLPPGIVSIVYAAQVNPKAQIGDLAGAQQSAQNARFWAFVGVGLGLLVYALYIVVLLLDEVAR